MTKTLRQMGDELSEAIAGQLRVHGKSLDAQIRKAGRRLPRRVRQDAIYIAQGMALSENPKLARLIDMAKAQKAHRNVLAYLGTVDVGAQRRNAALNLVASIAFALLVTGVLLLSVLWLRGFI